MTLEQELLSYQIGYVILLMGFIILGVMVIHDSTMRKKLQKYGSLVTRRGVYTFTPHNKEIKK